MSEEHAAPVGPEQSGQATGGPEGGMPEFGGPPPAPMKKVSGLLVVSMFLSFSGFLGFAVLGPLAGLITGWFGFKRVKKDPLLVGPRFAAFCLLMAGVALPLNVITLAIAYDEIMWLPDGFEKIHTVMVKTKDRDYAAAYDVMSDEYKAKMTKDEFVAMLRGFFPGTDPLRIVEDVPLIREKEWDYPALREAAAVMYQDDRPPFEWEVPVCLTHLVQEGMESQRRQVYFDFRLWGRKKGFAEYDVKILDVVVRHPPDAEKSPADAPEKPPEEAPEKTPEDAPEDEPK
jgi:hypothetical protein